MDSTSLPLCITNIPSSLSNTNSSFFAKPTKLFLHGRRSQSFKVSCNANNTGTSGHDKILDAHIDRRNVLLGLGGLYGAANVVPLTASATPIPPPDLKSCGPATITDGPTVPYSCCPPSPDNLDNIPYYEFPSMTKLRIRSPAQTIDEEYIAKYNLAIKKMKELDTKDKNDPRGFKQQANVHCAYCNGAYKIGGKELQVHNNWLFFPFHRWYLYFYERILGTLIDDPTFALPYWNWDNPQGMRLPPIFDVEGSPLYNERRNPHVRNGTVMDLGFFGDEVQTTELLLMTNNLVLMYRQMVTNAPCPLLFFGAPYVLGNNIEAPGTIELIPHDPVHIWTGTVQGSKLPDTGELSYGEDLGNFYSSGLEPAFFCHHSNVDRLWDEWKLIGGKRRDISDRDWLNSEFFFFDENKNPFLVKIRDCLDSKKMGYGYAPMPTPWRNFKPKYKINKGKVNTASLPPASTVFPIAKLDKIISFSINRPATLRTQQEKNEKEEILTFDNVRYDNREYIRFDVFLNVDNNVNTTDLNKKEYAGSYTSLPHVHKPNGNDHIATAIFRLAITELLEDIGLESEKTIAVTLVPKKGGEVTSIESAEIKLEDC